MNRKFLWAVGMFAVYASLTALVMILVFAIWSLIASADAAQEIARLAMYLGLSFASLVSGSVILLLVEIADAVAPARETEKVPLMKQMFPNYKG